MIVRISVTGVHFGHCTKEATGTCQWHYFPHVFGVSPFLSNVSTDEMVGDPGGSTSASILPDHCQLGW